ncbi:hypothetical protein FJ958_27450 [Mesorhizobium sp. B2-3-5]|nr:hypothetical protein FJ958_27450 [Mesorhizobium sp. B2-3-5]
MVSPKHSPMALRRRFFCRARRAVGIREWAAEQVDALHLSPRERFRVIAGCAGADRPDVGATVCSCFGVGVNQIAMAVASGCKSVSAIGEKLKAGTNCGSCRAEIRAIIEGGRLYAAE